MTAGSEHGTSIPGQEEAVELLRFVRAAIRQELGGPAAVPPRTASCQRPGAAFVTLRWPDGRLQGCIGNLEPRGRPLVEEVGVLALAAAFRDPRGRALELDDADTLEVELSILGPLEPVPFDDEASARAALRPQTDGIVLEWRGRRAAFLPQMWAQLKEPDTFLASLRLKAGLPSDFWSDEIRLLRFGAEIFVDPPVSPAAGERAT